MSKQKGMAWPWIFKMAFRDSRSNRKKLFLYMSAIIVGVAAQVAITSFRDNLNNSVNEQAKELLGADIEIEKNSPFDGPVRAYIDSLGAEESTAVDFTSMAYFPKTGATRLSQISAFEGNFPFYGDLITEPEGAGAVYQERGGALVDNAILEQFGLQPGDSVKVGYLTYEIVGGIIEIPGQPVATSFFGPRVFIPQENVEETGLLQRGSRVEYVSYLKFPDNINVDDVEDRLREIDRAGTDIRFDTVEERKEEVGEAITYLSNFLNLIGFIALILGGIGVASSIYVYIRQKTDTVAIMRCIGVSSDQAMYIYLVQAGLMGLIGSLIGAALGSFIQYYFPLLVADFIPVDVQLSLSWTSIGIGLLTGLVVSLLFALYPLLAVKKISPLNALRSVSNDLFSLLGKKIKIILTSAILAGIFLYAWLMISEPLPAFFFTLGMVACVGLLALFARGVMKAASGLIRSTFTYEVRQGLANLYRPNNQTTTLLLTIGLGVTLISSMYLTQDMLLERLDFSTDQELPNIALYDIQFDQNEGVNSIIKENDLGIIQNVPIVTMRIQGINGRTVEEIMADTSRRARRWAFNREYRSTYRDSLLMSEELVQGKFTGFADPSEGPVPVSLEQDIVGDLNVSMGDTITWDVQGIPIQTIVGSSRTVKWDQPMPNFFAVFPTGVLEGAPQFFATTVRSPNRESTLKLQQEIVQAYPNVSAIDVGQVLNTIQVFTDKITFVIQFMGLFSIITGLIVLIGSSATSRFQRIREGVLLRTLGAHKKQVVKIQIFEYILIGLMASLTGLILSVGSSMLIAYFFFDISFVPDFLVIGAEAVLLILIVVMIGVLNTRGMHSKPPLDVLRAEAN
ncbi:ABC transporter permease [Balneola sp. MJW-20]|uniref:ABC transporter permease n=1 Tax=Gracilimonas aurantiaca TaxID=3234185 RepID=UPI0034657A39